MEQSGGRAFQFWGRLGGIEGGLEIGEGLVQSMFQIPIPKP